ncbi:MAG: phosphatase PAP2 family protein [Elusimicrobia bacterium]|nr:phosphatase PAP2 family protein [Elusimicrobiota bacterium]
MGDLGLKPQWRQGDIVEALLLGAAGWLAFAYYEVVGRLAALRGTDLGPMLHSRLDDAMPYLPILVFPYALAFVMPVVAAIILARKGGLHAFRRGFFAYLGLLALHFMVYLSFPSSARGIMLPAEAVSRGAFAWAVNIFYGAAPPWNAFPSFHVAGCWFFYRVLARWAPRPARIYHAWFWVMAVGTAAIKIHWVADAAAGFLLAEAYYRVVLVPLEARGACGWTWESERARLAAHVVPLFALAAGLGLATLRFGWLLGP